MGKALEVFTSIGVESSSTAFRAVERVHDRVRTYLGVCCVSSVLFVTVKDLSPASSKVQRGAARKKLFPAKKKPIVIDDFLMRLLGDEA